jgi:3-oxoacyl-[acyl-carrier protein] reductase
MSPSSAALITGASRGIGEAIARALAANGTPVALLALHSDRLAKVADEITEAGGTAVMRAVDVREAEAVREAVRELATELAVPISLVVNNAGRIDREVPLWQADPSQWRDVVETNLIGSFHVSHATIPLMLEHGGGRVIELVSGAGAKDWAKASAYVSSKAAMIRNVGHLHEAGVAQFRVVTRHSKDRHEYFDAAACGANRVHSCFAHDRSRAGHSSW